MSKSKFTESQIVAILGEGEAGVTGAWFFSAGFLSPNRRAQRSRLGRDGFYIPGPECD
jgi:hypothetical protein